MHRRSDRRPVTEWWRTVDRWFLFSFFALIAFGIVLSFAASPDVAQRIGLDTFHFVERHAMFIIPAIAVMIGISFLEDRQVRRVALVVLLGSMALMVATLFFGVEVKGSRRWVRLAGVSIQPSEFMKPAFVIICAWLFSEHLRRPDIPGNLLAGVLFAAIAALLVAQPDLGQTVLVAATWGAMFFMAGMSWLWIVVLGSIGILGLAGAYLTLPHVASRIDGFLSGAGDTFQVDTGREAIVRGGWFGQGPGEGTIKRVLPDSHTDFVFAVLAEEFGILLCMVLVAVFALIVLRGLTRSFREDDHFRRLAVAGLVTLIGLQSMINIMVNLQLLPAKGMTLPFVSYGGSSMLAVAITAGFVLALTRRRPATRFGHVRFSGDTAMQAAEQMAVVGGTVLLSAGGTGGHLFPAEALAHELIARGWSVHLATDARAEKYAGRFPGPMHVIRSDTPSGKNPLRLIGAGLSLFAGMRQSRRLLAELKPGAVVGFGGYPTVPPVFVAAGIFPTMIHEQNAVMGRANRMLAGRVSAIAGGFLKADGPMADKIVVTGNPVRPPVIEAAAMPYDAPDAVAPIRLVVFGGSQGARFFSEAIPAALALLPEELRARIEITQQARPEDERDAMSAYEALGVAADVAPFFSDLPARIGAAHLVMARSGASTVSEIAAIGRPAIFVPYPYALDHDQAANAEALADAGGALVRRQSELTPQVIADLFAELLGNPPGLSEMAARAKAAGHADAAALLADLTEAIAEGQSPADFRARHG